MANGRSAGTACARRVAVSTEAGREGKALSRILATLIAALVIAACSESPQERIVGVWYDRDDDTTVQFFADGRIVVDDVTPVDIRGTYQLLDDSRMSLDLRQGRSESISVVVTYELGDDTLILTAPDGDTSKMTRRDR